MTLRWWDLLLTAGSRACNHCDLYCQGSPIFSLLSRTTLDPLPVLSWPNSTRHMFLAFSPQNISVSIGPLSRWCLSIAVQDKGSDRMSFTEASLSQQYSHSLTISYTEFKASGDYRPILQLELPVCPRAIWFTYDCIFSPPPPPPAPAQWAGDGVWDCFAFVSPFCFSIVFNYLATSFVLPDALPLFKIQLLLCYMTFLTESKLGTLLIYHLFLPFIIHTVAFL